MKQNKKGLVWNALIPGIIGLFILGIVAYVSLGPTLKSAINGTFSIANKTWGEEGFVPYKEELDSEERTVLNSMTALITSINALVGGKEIYEDLTKVDSNSFEFDSYTIRWSGEIELNENSGGHDKPKWIFEEKFLIKNNTNISRQVERVIAADYTYGSCQTKNKWAKCNKNTKEKECYCHTKDDYSPGNIDDEVSNIIKEHKGGKLLKSVISKKLAPVMEAENVYNIELITYKGGKEICRISTAKKGELLIKKANFPKDLLAWGAAGSKGVASCPGNSLFSKGDGCDRDGDGIQGAYGTDYYGRKWDKVIDITNDNKEVAKEKKQLVSNKKIIAYFDEDGKIKSTSKNGEGCLDSPTWIECPGIRAYYCGHLGLNSYSPQYFHMDSEGNAVSNTGAKFFVNLDNKKFITPQSSHNRKDNEKNIIIRDDYSGSWGDKATGSWSYAKEFDLDLIVGFITMGPIGGLMGISIKERENPSIYCYNAKTINEGPVTVKCDPNTKSCGICDFELPQNISKDYNTTLTFLSGYGDPKYVVYYEAFPYGEEEAWILSELELGLGSIVTWNIAAHVVIPVGGAVIKQGIKLSKATAKFLGKITSKYIGGQAIKKGIKLVKWPGKKATEGITFLKDKVSTYVKSGVDKVTYKVLSPNLYLRIFTNADNILKYASPADLKKVGKTVEDVAEALFTKDQGFLDAAEHIMRNKKILSKYDIFMKRLPFSITQKGPKYGLAYAAALAIALEDSQNEKFYPIGINNIGIKQPYDVVFKTGIQLPKLEENVSKYYIQLKRDKYKGGTATGKILNQPTQRFFLASPCKANLLVSITECNCWEVDDNSDIEVPGESIIDQVGSVPVLISSVNEEYPKNNTKRYTNAEKVCRDRNAGLTSITFTKPIYKGECISVKPVLIGDTFCYSGSHTLAEIAQIGVFMGTVTASIAAEAVFTTAEVLSSPTVIGPIGIEAVNIAFDIGIDAFGMLIVHALVDSTKWPKH